MSWHWHDVLGSLGAVMIVIAYWALQSGRLTASSLRYSLANAIGSGLILFSLAFRFNLSAFLIEFFWLLISFYGIGRILTRRRAIPAHPTTARDSMLNADKTTNKNKAEPSDANDGK